ncbi:MAG TPA: ornithine cyclodeaminase family protein [Thermoanaerobaculia bacterium]|jgi:ornithine cyclodeaminase/alanine dehydrogenase-like protein (mu-crystallin family)
MNAGTDDPGTLLLTGGAIAALLDLPSCIAAVEDVLRRHAAGETVPPRVLGLPSIGGGLHVKGAGLLGSEPRLAVKVNANFPANPERFGLPAIQGVLVLFDGVCGRPLAVLDSMMVTALRTAAASALAARHLARPDSTTLTVCGCGRQGAMHARALCGVLPIARVLLWDLDPRRAERLAAELAPDLADVEMRPAPDLPAALARTDVCATCTPARGFFIRDEDVRSGTFIAATGADDRGKQELDPRLVTRATLVVDALAQCAELGELQHALAAGLMTAEQVHAELAEIVSGTRPGRSTPEEITIFDSTGTALQDLAAAIVVEKRARMAGAGRVVHLGA